MAYTPPSTVTGSDVLTAALWNAQIRDNLEWLRKPPACRAVVTSAYTITNLTAITYNSASYDTDPTMWTISQPSRITIRTAGLWRIESGGVLTAPTTISEGTLHFKVNGNYVLNVGIKQIGANIWKWNASTVQSLSVNDYVEMALSENSVSPPTLTISATQSSTYNQTYLSATWMGALT